MNTQTSIEYRAFPTFKRYPGLIVEVLSDQTEGVDRGDKFADYQELNATGVCLNQPEAPASRMLSAQC